ncbi:hypothetical protein VHEMI04300 [[Torrubiella] hemipterigena]|uniref:Uncharacterized protein n=1 Tax=[Torrubiella] hemipterigena TaxID=1531966 RepID=A0A0A1T0U9_9HYPO|nr:hypothetical protein VHEMI04300 [[Torrubiella] hemipterigena]
MPATMRRGSGASAFLNSLAAALAVVLLAGAIKLKTQLVVVSQPNDGFTTLDINPSMWNVGVTIVGSVVGLLASVAFSAQDAYLTRMRLASTRGMSAIFLRPLTAMRGLQQVARGEINAERALLVLLMLGTALSSAVTVALFSVQDDVVSVTNTHPSFPLASLGIGSNFFQITPDGAVFPIVVPLLGSGRDINVIPFVESFVYRSAFIQGQAARLGHILKQPLNDEGFLPVQGLLGYTTYGDLWTAGVGINAASYATFPGFSSILPLPVNYTLSSLSGQVYGATVNVTCENRTSSYDISTSRPIISGVIVTASRFGEENGSFRNNITMYIDRTQQDLLPISFNLSTSASAQPMHVVLVTDTLGSNAQVFECTYQGREIVVNIDMPGPSMPLSVGTVAIQGPAISPSIMRTLVATPLQSIIGIQGGGSILAKAFVDAKYNDGGDNTTAHFGDVLATVLSQSGQAIISAVKQSVEIPNLDSNGLPKLSRVFLDVNLVVKRVGGGSYGWIAVYAAILMGSLLGLARTLVGGNAINFDAQDSVMLLSQAMKDSNIKPKAKVRFSQEVDQIQVVGQEQIPEPSKE